MEAIQHIAEKRLTDVTVYPHLLGTIVLDQLRNATCAITTYTRAEAPRPRTPALYLFGLSEQAGF